MWVHPAIQIARHLGAHVVTTAAPRRDAWLTGLGAEQVIDYTDLDFVEVLRDDPVDVVLDLVGGAVGPRSAGVLRAGGLLVELPEGIDGPTRAAAKAASVRVVTHAVTLDRPRLTEIASPAAAGVLTAHLCEVRPLSEAADAHRTIEAGHVTGKLVLQPWRTRVRHRPSARRATHDRVAHVTGDSGGIGRPTARRLAADGLAVVVHYTGNPDSAEETVAAITADGGIATALGRRCRRRGGDSALIRETENRRGRRGGAHGRDHDPCADHGHRPSWTSTGCTTRTWAGPSSSRSSPPVRCGPLARWSPSRAR